MLPGGKPAHLGTVWRMEQRIVTDDGELRAGVNGEKPERERE